MSDTKRVNITVSLEMHDYYKEQARKSGVSMSAAMSTSLYQHMMNSIALQKKLDK